MPKLTKKDLEKISEYTNTFQKQFILSDTGLIDKDKIELMIYAYASKCKNEVSETSLKCVALFALYSKACEKTIDEGVVSYSDSPSMYYQLNKIGYDRNQLNFIYENIDSLDKFSSIDKGGVFEEFKEDEIYIEEDSSNSVPFDEDLLHEEMIADIYSELDSNYNGINPCTNVIFDKDFFTNYIENGEYSKQVTFDFLVSSEYQSILNYPEVIQEQRTKTNIKASKCYDKITAMHIAEEKIGHYLSAKTQIENIQNKYSKTINYDDIPSATLINLNIQMALAKNDLKESYGFSESAINKIETIIKTKKFPNNFKILNEDGTIIGEKRDDNSNEINNDNNIVIEQNNTPKIEKGFQMENFNFAINNYLNRKENWDKKTIGDFIKHPFKSIFEYINLNKSKKELTDNYELTDYDIRNIKESGYNQFLNKNGINGSVNNENKTVTTKKTNNLNINEELSTSTNMDPLKQPVTQSDINLSGFNNEISKDILKK